MGLLILKAYLRGGTLQVVNVVTPMLLNEYSLKGSSCSTFLRLQHLTLMIEPRQCSRNKASELNASMANLGVHSQLESLYIGFASGFDCSDYDRIQSDQEDSIILRLSSMQHLESVHLDSFWPALLELPTGASLHATFKSAPGQKHPGLWAGRPADVQNPRLPLRSAHFLPGPGLGPEHAVTAKELWPLKVKRSLELIRVVAGTLCLNLLEFPGLMQAGKVFITALECHMIFPYKHKPYKHLKLRSPKHLRLVISIANIFAAQLNNLTLSREDLMDPCPLSVLFLRDAMLAAGNELSVTRRHTMCQPEGRLKHWMHGCGIASSDVEHKIMDADEWARAVRCCCHACLACLHRDGTATFPEAVAEENTMLGV